MRRGFAEPGMPALPNRSEVETDRKGGFAGMNGRVSKASRYSVQTAGSSHRRLAQAHIAMALIIEFYVFHTSYAPLAASIMPNIALIVQ